MWAVRGVTLQYNTAHNIAVWAVREVTLQYNTAHNIAVWAVREVTHTTLHTTLLCGR